MCGDQDIRGVSYFWKILEQSLPLQVKEAVKGMRMCADNRGVVFDLPSELQDIVQVVLVLAFARLPIMWGCICIIMCDDWQ